MYCIGHLCFASLLPDMAVQKLFIALVRGFPDRMLECIRQQPCTALLQTMLRRQSRASPADYLLGSVKVSTCTSRRDRPVTKHDLCSLQGDYIRSALPAKHVTSVGWQALNNNYWLFPVIVVRILKKSFNKCNCKLMWIRLCRSTPISSRAISLSWVSTPTAAPLSWI